MLDRKFHIIDAMKIIFHDQDGRWWYWSWEQDKWLLWK